MQNYMKLVVWTLMLSAIVLSGCAGTNPLPMAGRAGDTITLAVGSAKGMTIENTTVTFTPDDTNIASSELPVRSILNVYPDRESTGYWSFSGWLQYVSNATGHSPWLTIVVIDLPTNIMGGATGGGNITVATEADYGSPEYDINGKVISFTVLPGVGEPHPLQWHLWGPMGSDLPQLQKAHRIVVTANSHDTLTYLGAVELRLQFEEGDLAPGPQHSFYVVPEDFQYVTESMRQVSWSVQDNDVLLVTFMSPVGYLVPTELNFSFIPRLNAKAVSAPMPANFPSAPTLLSATYYDVNGNVATGPAVEEYMITRE